MERLPLPASLTRRLGYPNVADLGPERQDALRFFWLDGLFASISLALVEPYYTLYLLALGATRGQIGLVNTLLQVAGALAALPGAALAERRGRYKQVTLICGGVLGRVMWLVMMVAPWALADAHAVWLILIAWVGISAFGSLGGPAWTALSADIVPLRIRGQYFASRNIVSSVGRLAFIPLAGQIVNWVGSPTGYQVNLGLALVMGAISTYLYSLLPEHVPHVPIATPATTEAAPPRPTIWRNLPRPFVAFTAAHAVFMFGAMFAGPFFPVLQSQVLGFDVFTIGMIPTINTAVALIVMRYMGRWQDRFGNTWLMRFAVGVPFIPLVWMVWIREPWQAYLMEIVSGVAWTAYNLAAFNLLLATTPDEHRPRYAALHTTVVALASAISPTLAGGLLELVGFEPVFYLSTIIRCIGLVLMLTTVREPKPVPEAQAAPPA